MKTDNENQKQALIDMMKKDEDSGVYKQDREEVTEMIAKVHEDIEGRYELDSYDKGIIHHLLCQLQTSDGSPS